MWGTISTHGPLSFLALFLTSCITSFKGLYIVSLETKMPRALLSCAQGKSGLGEPLGPLSLSPPDHIGKQRCTGNKGTHPRSPMGLISHVSWCSIPQTHSAIQQATREPLLCQAPSSTGGPRREQARCLPAGAHTVVGHTFPAHTSAQTGDHYANACTEGKCWPESPPRRWHFS